MAVIIESLEKNSPADRLGLQAGDSLLSIDGNELNDMLDYEFYTARSSFQLQAVFGGSTRTVQVTKQEYEPFGCNFKTYLIDKQHCCCNGCIFCFVDQMPPGMRKELYFKDDDERLSFLYGTYITLTNLSQKEVDRIARMRISPINISVHTVDPEMRVKMMKNRRAGEVLSYIDQFAAAGIEMNFQIVLCPGWNDGERLQQSLEKLSGYYPQARSVAVVPIGVTRYREKLPQLQTFDKEGAAKVIDQIEAVGSECLRRYGERIVYPSDELFLLAERPIPPDEYYGDYSQLENGVGMMRLLMEQFSQALKASRRRWLPRRVDLVTGEAAYPLMCQLSQQCMRKNPAVRIRVHMVKNDFFGGNIVVTGLVTGGDLIRQLKGKLLSHELILPRVMLRAERDLFLDDVSVDDVRRQLGVRLRITESGGDDLLNAMLGRRAKERRKVNGVVG